MSAQRLLWCAKLVREWWWWVDGRHVAHPACPKGRFNASVCLQHPGQPEHADLACAVREVDHCALLSAAKAHAAVYSAPSLLGIETASIELHLCLHRASVSRIPPRVTARSLSPLLRKVACPSERPRPVCSQNSKSYHGSIYTSDRHRRVPSLHSSRGRAWAHPTLRARSLFLLTEGQHTRAAASGPPLQSWLATKECQACPQMV